MRFYQHGIIIVIFCLAACGVKSGYSQQFDLEIQPALPSPFYTTVGQPFFPIVNIVNHGPEPAPQFTTYYYIHSSGGTLLYSASQFIEAGLPPEEVMPVQFDPWVPEFPGEFATSSFIEVHGDENPQNDSLFSALVVESEMMSRAQAIQIVEESVISTSPFADSLVGFLYNQTGPDSVLHNGDTVLPWDSSFVQIINSETYFFWLDDMPETEWLHPATFVFVDAHSGEVVTFEAQSWPVVNGEEITGFMEDGNDSPGKFRGSYKSPSKSYEYTTRKTSNEKDWAVIVVGRNLHGATERHARLNDLARIKECLNGVKLGPQVTGANIVTVSGADTKGATIQAVCDSLKKLKGKACRKLYFYYIGHGKEGGVILKKEGENASETLKYEQLAGKLLELGVPEVCIIIEACHSGSAIKPMRDKSIKKNGKTVKLKGVIVTSSSRKNTTKRFPNGAPFNVGVNKCCKDPKADLNKDGKVTIVEAVAWAKIKNKVIAGDKPQASTLGDSRRIAFGKPYIARYHTGVDGTASLNFQVETYCYGIKKSASSSKYNIICRKFLYVSHTVHGPHRGRWPIEVYCKGKRGRIRVIHTFRPNLGPKQRLCIAEVPNDCGRLYFRRKKKNSMAVAAASVQESETMALDFRAGIYSKGEYIFQDKNIINDSSNTYLTFVDDVPGWGLTIDPSFFTTSALLDTEAVIIRGTVPDTATQGADFTATLINSTQNDTLPFLFQALLFDSLGHGIAGGETYKYQALANHGSFVISGDQTTIDNSVISQIEPANYVVEQNGVLFLRHTAIISDSAAYSLTVSGALEWQNSSLVSPQDGLILDGADAHIYGGAILKSQGNGLTLTGDQSLTEINFMHIDSSAQNGLEINDAGTCIVRNVSIENSAKLDVSVNGNSSVTLLDCDFDDAKVSVDANATLQRSWTTFFYIADSSGAALPGVQIEIHDAADNLAATGISDTSGFSPEFRLSQFEFLGSQRTNLTPHKVTLRNSQYDTTFALDINRQTTHEIILPSSAAKVADSEATPPKAFRLYQNYPNPFNPTTTIQFAVKKRCHVFLKIYDMRGREIMTLIDGEYQPGEYRQSLDAHNWPSGVYFYRIRMNDFSAVKKMLLLQ